MPAPHEAPRWLLLIHQLPREPAYFRVKVGRRLASIGAIALKNSVYVLPVREQTAEDFAWIRNEIIAGGGDATVVEAHLVSGLSDDDVEDRFRAAKDAEYAELIAEAEAVEVTPRGRRKRPLTADERRAALSSIVRIAERADAATATDFFDAKARNILTALLETMRAKLDLRAAPASLHVPRTDGRTWVTRANIHVDRIASAWLIRRSIDVRAQFAFVSPSTYAHREGELRFDMFEAEYSHEGDDCTFETLLRRFALHEPGLHALAEVVHDIDIKDAKFGRPETAGIAACVAGICRTSPDDDTRLDRGSMVFDALLAHFAAKSRKIDA